MTYKTIDEWIEHNPNHIGALPIEVCHQIWGTKGKGISMTQPEQEPIGYASEGAAERLTTVKQAHEQIRSFKLFTHDVPLYTAPQREFVGLTDEEIWETISRIGTSDSDVNPYAKLADARAIEAKLRSKNNG